MKNGCDGRPRSAVAGGVDSSIAPLLLIGFPEVVNTQSTMPHLQLVPAAAPEKSVASAADDDDDDDVTAVEVVVLLFSTVAEGAL